MSDEAFAAAAAQVLPALRAYCVRLARSRDRADDLVQETLLRAWRGRHGFEGRSTLRAWLYRIATNAHLDALRRERTRAAVDGLDTAVDGNREPVASPAQEPETVALVSEDVDRALLTAVRVLPPRQRTVLVLREGFGWTAQEVAGTLGGSVASVNSALQRARATLRRDAGDPETERTPSATATAAELEQLARWRHALAAAERPEAANEDRT